MHSADKSRPTCPSCERFIGPASVCPYCDADAAVSPVLRILRWAAVFTAVLGLLFLYLMAVNKNIPIAQIGDITQQMDFAHIRVVGTVQNMSDVQKTQSTPDYVWFTIKDPSGRLLVTASGKVAASLVDQQLLPQKGDKVEVTGAISVASEGRFLLRLRSSAQIRIMQPNVSPKRPSPMD